MTQPTRPVWARTSSRAEGNHGDLRGPETLSDLLKVTQQIKARTGTPTALFTVTQGVAGSLGEATADHRPSRGPVLLSRENNAWLGSETAWDCPVPPARRVNHSEGRALGTGRGTLQRGRLSWGQRVSSRAAGHSGGSEKGPGTAEQPVASQGLGEFPCPGRREPSAQGARAGKGLVEGVPLCQNPGSSGAGLCAGSRVETW